MEDSEALVDPEAYQSLRALDRVPSSLKSLANEFTSNLEAVTQTAISLTDSH